MIEKGQKDFTFKFSPDEEVEVTELNYKGSKGYVTCIKVDRNGIMYDVILTELVSRSKLPGHVFAPIKAEFLESFLKPLEL